MRKGFYEYESVIYPRKLWVSIGNKINYVRDMFCYVDGCDIGDFGEKADAVTYGEVMRRDDGKYGNLVCFSSKQSMTMSIISHESSHVCDNIEKALDIEHGGETSAYLIGWIASCINKARLGKGDFVDWPEYKQSNTTIKDNIKIGDIIFVSLNNGVKIIGAYGGKHRNGYDFLNPCIVQQPKSGSPWVFSNIKNAFPSDVVLAFRLANKPEESVYKEELKKYDRKGQD